MTRHKYRLVRRAAGSSPPLDIRALWERDRRRCGISHGPVGLREPVLDHIIPKTAPGAVDDSPHNLQIAHSRCNSQRGNARIAAQLRLRLPSHSAYWDRPRKEQS